VQSVAFALAFIYLHPFAFLRTFSDINSGVRLR
jgi:hypothetical protein